MSLRGPPWAAAIFPMLPGAYWCLRVTVSDALALALALAAVFLATRNRLWPAIALGCLAVLAKEPAVLVLLGWSLYRRTRRDALLTVVPGIVIVAWMGWLHVILPPDPTLGHDIGLPFVGLYQAWTQIWSHGNELVGMACTISGMVIGALALAVRRFRHPLGWAIAVQLGFMLTMGLNPTSTNFGGTRMAMPVMALSVLALCTPRGRAALDGAAEVEPAEPVPAPA